MASNKLFERANDEDLKGSSITLHAHGDGTYHTTSENWGGGNRTEHPSIGHALMHIAKRHSEGDHVHIQAHDEGYTVHHVREGERIRGPHEVKNLRALKGAVVNALDEDGEEEE